MGTVRRSVRFASLLACATWIVSLAGYFVYEPAGLHTVEDSRKVVFSESDADSVSGQEDKLGPDAPDNRIYAVFSRLDGSVIASLRRPSPLRNGIGRLAMIVDQFIDTTALPGTVPRKRLFSLVDKCKPPFSVVESPCILLH